MLQWMKLHFIPSHANDHQPHFLRLQIAGTILFFVLLIETTYLLGTTFVLPKSEGFASIFATVLVEQTNKERLNDNLGSLTVSPRLEAAAKMKAEDMATKGYFSHNSPDGKNPWYWFDQAGYDYAAAGENLAVNFTDSKDVTSAWMHSASHRANILSGNYTEIGIATAQGIYKGKSAIFVVQEFGRPSIIARQIDNASSTINALSVLITGVATPTIGTSVTPAAGTVVKPGLALTPTKPSVVPVAQAQTAPSVKAPARTVVAGAETQKLDVKAIPPPAHIAVESPQKPSTLEVIVASPRQTTTAAYLLLAAVLLAALLLTIFINMRVQHPHIIRNGIVLIAIILLILYFNTMFGFMTGVV